MNRISLLALVTLGLCSTAGAVTTWNFSSNPDHSLGVSSQTYTVGGVTITATGFYNNDSARILYDKFTTDVNNNESGLGFTDDSFLNHEIDTNGFVVLDLSSSFFAGKSLSLTITSIQAGESYQWSHGSATHAGQATDGLTLVGSNLISSPLIFTGGGANSFIAIEATSHNVLINSLTAAAVPEPRFYGLLLAGLLGFAGIVYRKRRVTE
jgi:hypothetical protein